MNSSTKKIVMASLLASLCCVATMIIKIPSPLKGYINLGDCVVLLTGFTLSPIYAFLSAGIGSALADMFSGYLLYVPATFLIKGGVALIVAYGFSKIPKNLPSLIGKIIICIIAEVFMVLGYYIFEGVLYGFIPSVVNIPANAIQGVAGIILGIILSNLFEKHKISL